MPKRNMNGGAIVIEHDIPPPKKRHRYPLEDMKVGDSILVPASVRHTSSIVSTYGRGRDAKFTCRTVEGGTRVWRIE